MAMSVLAGYVAKLEQRKQQALYRQRRLLDSAQGAEVVCDGQTLINFSSNDYLGLAKHPAITQALQQAADLYGAGSGASHLVVGHNRAHHQLEEQLADFLGYEAVLLFSSGYMANLGIITALTESGDWLLQDKLNHASLLDAGQLGKATMKRYRHSDMASLGLRLEDFRASQQVNQDSAKCLIVSDAVFSMDGDNALLSDLESLAVQHKALWMLDDAHGFGVLGDHGRGSLEHFGMSPKALPIYMATLSKACGVYGAFAAGDKPLIDYLMQTARSYIYTTALPPALAAASSAALTTLQTEAWRRHHLRQLISQFRQGMANWSHLLLDSETPIQPLVIGSADQALALSQSLQEQGFLVVAIRPPTVPENTARLRITLSAAHTEVQVRRLLEALQNLLPEVLQEPESI